MKGRHYLVDALIGAIISGDDKNTLTLFSLIPKNQVNASLANRDQQGRSILNLAFEYASEEIAGEFLQLCQDNADLVFASDHKQKTLLWHAANRGFRTLAIHLLKLAESYPSGSKQGLFWLQADMHGDTPLHRAAYHKHANTLKVLTEKIMREPDAIDLINKPNRDGDTALHYAFANGCYPAMLQLVNSGADMLIHNNENKIPCDDLERFSDEEQLEIFVWLADRLGSIAAEAEGKPPCRYQLLARNRTTLMNLISRITTHINILESKQKIPDINIKLGKATPTFIMLVFAYYSYSMLTQPKSTTADSSFSSTMLAILALLSAYLVAVSTAITTARYYSNKEISIPGRELRDLQKNISDDFLDQVDPAKSQAYEIRSLADENHRLAQTEAISVVIDKLKRLKKSLLVFVEDMNVSLLPFSIFHPIPQITQNGQEPSPPEKTKLSQPAL